MIKKPRPTIVMPALFAKGRNMRHIWKSHTSSGIKTTRVVYLASILLLSLSTLMLTASSSSPQTLSNGDYQLTASPGRVRLCVGKKKQLRVNVKGEIHERIGKNEKERGRVFYFWYLPDVTITLSDPTLGKFTGKKPESPPELVTDGSGNAYATFVAEKEGEEVITIKASGEDLRTVMTRPEKVDLETKMPIKVEKCKPIPIINVHGKLDLGKGAHLIQGMGGGEAEVDDEGNLSGDGEMSLTERMILPQPYCTAAESSGQAAFTIKGKMDDQNINLQFDFKDLTVPPASATCTAKGVSIPVQALPGSSGDPGEVLGFNSVSVPAGGGSVDFPIPVAEYTGGTTVVVILVPEESGTSNLDPFGFTATIGHEERRWR